MAFNGAGTFARIYNWVADKANNVKITASRMDAEMDGFATGLSTCIAKDGQTLPTADLPMNGHKHTGVTAGTARTHYADVGSAQDGAYHWCGTAGGTANALTLTPTPAIAAYAAGQLFRFTAGASANSGAVTIAVSGLAARAVQINGAALTGGEILAAKTYDVLYDGTQFQLFGSVTFPTYAAVGQANQGSGHAAFSIKSLAASEAQLKLVQNNATDDGWLFNADGPGGGILKLQRRESGATTTRAVIGTDGKAAFGQASLPTGPSLSTSGSVSALGSDSNFAAGGNRAMMDVAGAYIRLGAIAGGGSAVGLKIMVNNGEVMVFDSAGAVTHAGSFSPSATNSHDLGTGGARWRTLYVSDIYMADTGGDHFLRFASGENLAASRTLSFVVNDASRTLTLGADSSISGTAVVLGIREFYVDAEGMKPATTNGAAPGSTESTTNKVMYGGLDFDQTTQEFAHFKFRMPKSWNGGTITFIPDWTAASGSGGVVWALQGVAIGNDDAIDVAFGTEQTSTDTLLATGDEHSGPESAAITIAGSPAAGDMIYFRIKRNSSDGSDTLAADARLLGITIRCTVDKATDA